MEYRCKTIPIGKVPVGPRGVILPLCNTCQCKDCTNPIQSFEISIQGATQKHRIYMRNDEPYFVIICEGFME